MDLSSTPLDEESHPLASDTSPTKRPRRPLARILPVLLLLGVAGLAALVCAFSSQRFDGPVDFEGIIQEHAVPPDPAGATNGDAVPFPNIYYATLGYNLYYGDPLPILKSSSTTLSMDPGLRKPLFALEYSKGQFSGDRRHTQPDGYHATVDEGCSTVFSTKKIRSSYEYQTENQESVGLYARVEAAVKFPPTAGKMSKNLGKDASVGISGKAFARAGGSMSLQFKNMEEAKSLRDQEMYRSQAKCSSYVAAFSFAFPPKPHPDFKKAVDGLGSSASQYYALFDEFGTHMLTAVKMGARYGTSMFIDRSKSSAMQKEANGLKVSLEASMGAVAKIGIKKGKNDVGVKQAVALKASLPLLTPKEKTVANTFKNKFINEEVTSVVGPPLTEEGAGVWSEMVNAKPVPISWDSQPICRHPAFETKSKHDNCEKFLESYCEGHLKKKGGTCAPPAERGCYNDLECKEGSVCRAWNCVEVPKCEVTIYKDTRYRGRSYTLPTVTAIQYMGGKTFDLENANWNDEISSIKLSDGCLKIEAVDDDGPCNLGKGDNGVFTSSQGELVSDLDNDVCKIKVWAKEPPPDTQGWAQHTDSYIGGYTGYGSSQVSLESGMQICLARSDCAGLTCYARDGGKCTLRKGPGVKHDPQGGVTYVKPKRRLLEVVAEDQAFNTSLPEVMPPSPTFLTPVSSEAAAAVPEDQPSAVVLEAVAAVPEVQPSAVLEVPLQELTEVVQPSGGAAAARRLGVESYLKNIGKAMYGYNHYFGAPASSENAGTDPGFMHRPVWKTSYSKNLKAEEEVFDSIPGVPAPAPPPPRPWYGPWGQPPAPMPYYPYFQPPASRCTRLPHEPGHGYKEVREMLLDDMEQDLKTYFLKDTSGDAGFVKHTDSYLAGYTFYGSRKVTIADGTALCMTRSDCAGITCYARDGGKCTLRRGPEIRSDQQHGTTYAKPDVSPEAKKAQEKCDTMANCHAIFCDQKGCSLFGETRMCRGWRADYVVYVKGEQPPAVPKPTTSKPPAEHAAHALDGIRVPDGWTVTKAQKTVCNTDFKTNQLKSRYDYEADMSNSLNPLGGRVDFGAFSFSFSSESREFSQSNAKGRKATYITTAECFDFLAEIKDLGSSPPPTSENFKFIVDAISEKEHYYSLFDMYGLHFPTKVYFGARYGFTQNIDESSYKTTMEKSSSMSMSAEVTKGIKAKKNLELSATAGVKYGNKESTAEVEEFMSSFTEVKEFSLGRRMPNEGGAAEWIKQVSGESMPFRYELTSICDHPALASRKAQCEANSKTYCKEHLVRVNANEGVSCDAPKKSECLWDLDCGRNKFCDEMGVCRSEPDCEVTVYSEEHQRGSPRTYGPVYYSDSPHGQVFSVGGNIDSVRASGGCAEVVLMDEDNCYERYEDNIVMENRRGNNAVTQNDLPNDLENDVCKVKLIAKQHWV